MSKSIEQISFTKAQKKNTKRTIIPLKKEKIKFNFKNTFSFLKNNYRNLFLAMFKTIIAIFISVVLFPENPGVFIIVLTTLFLTPYIYKQSKLNSLLFGKKTEVTYKDVSMYQMSMPSKTFSFSRVYYENKDILTDYLMFFLGVFFTIILFILIMPHSVSETVFSGSGWSENLIPSKNIGFENSNKISEFKIITVNNLSVLLICFIFALLFPTAGLLIIVWNAVFWGVIFTQYAVVYSALYNVTFNSIFLPVLVSSIPHILIEMIGYFLATTSGIILALSIKKDFNNPDKFTIVLKYAIVVLAISIIFVVAGSLFEVYFFDILKTFFFSLN
jgi:hypothetical protein